MQRDVILITLFALMIFLFLCNFMPLGVVGDALSRVMFGLTGVAGYVLPIFIFGVYLYYLLSEDRDPKTGAKTTAVICLFLIFMVMAHLISGNLSDQTGYDPGRMWRYCSENRRGGGIIGGSIAFVLYRMLHTFGSVLILLVAAIICIYIIGQRSFLELFRDKAMDARLAREERLEQESRKRKEEAAIPDESGLYDEEGRTSHYEESRRRYQDLRRARRLREARESEEKQKVVHFRGIVGNTDLSGEEGFAHAEDPDRDGIFAENITSGAVPDDNPGETINAGGGEHNTFDVRIEDTEESPEAPENNPAPWQNSGSFQAEEQLLHYEPDRHDEEETEQKSLETESGPGNDRTEIRDSDELHEIRPDFFFDEEEEQTGDGREQAVHKTAAEESPLIKATVIRDNPAPEEAEEVLAEDTPAEPDHHNESQADEVPLYNNSAEESDPYADMPDIHVIADEAETSDVQQSTIAIHTERETGSSRINEALEKSGQETTVPAASEHQNVLPAKPQVRPALKKREYVFPPISLLHPGRKSASDSDAELRHTAETLQTTLRNFGVNVTITDISQGPAVTRYEMLPEMGVKVSKIVSLADDIKLALAATDIRIEAPIPGKSAIGIEVPNKEAESVALHDIIDTDEFRSQKSRVAFAVGKDIAGKPVYGDIAKMPHVLIAGATGSGKSVCINTIIMSILYHAKPEEVKMIMIDPKVVELSVYNGIPHLLIPVVTDPQKAAAALNWGVAEMEARYRKFADAKVRDIKAYNSRVREAEKEDNNPDGLHFMPQIVIIVDELADLMMVAKADVETAICRLAQLARAAGIYLIIATQRPSVDVITGLIKANMPSRIAFRVSSGVDSRTILDMNGAEKLLGKGDMLFFPQGLPKPTRVQGCFVSDEEVNDVVHFVTQNNPPDAEEQKQQEEINSAMESGAGDSVHVSGSAGGSAEESHDPEQDELFGAAGAFIIEKNNASIGLLQRRYRIGFNRAARIMDQLCDAGVVSESEGTKSRNILMTMEQFLSFCQENGISVPDNI